MRRGGDCCSARSTRRSTGPWKRVTELSAPGISLPATLDVHMQTADMAEVASWVRGAERTGVRTVSIRGDDPLAMFRSFVAVTYITRVAEGR
jgi:D-amino peptidase